ncbi:histidine phosphatase family protein [Lacticaseibacillus jixiensis]|uniref:histidine phosphatase family protein n=1 Tax=Lacticaseibacillus jixiensis TaxID=3231926 RepID=UPI0036F255EC
MTEIYLIRHGQTVYNVQARIQGMADSELTALGQADAKALGRGLMQAGVVFDAAYSSDLKRAKDTAELALEAADQYLPVQTLPGLREEDYASLEGHPQQERTERLQKLLPGADVHDLTVIANGVHQLDAQAEDAVMVQKRFDATLRQIAATKAKRVMVVSHGTVSLLWLAYIGYDLHGQNKLNNASVTRLTITDRQVAVQEFDSLAYVEAGR